MRKRKCQGRTCRLQREKYEKIIGTVALCRRTQEEKGILIHS